MAYRSVWKGFLKLAQIACPVALYAATGEAASRSFTMINPKTGNKLDFSRVDSVTGEAIEFKDMAKGIEVAAGVYKEVTKDELEGIAPPTVHTIAIEELVPRAGIGWLFPDSLYYLGPDGLAAGEAFSLIRDGIRQTKRVALGQLTMGSHERIVMIEPGDKVLKVSTLRYTAEVRSEETMFPKFVDIPAPAELAEPVRKILEARCFDEFAPSAFADRYSIAIEQLVRDKIAGAMVKKTANPPPKLIDLAKAVKRSFDGRGKPHRGDRRRGKAA